MPIFLNPITQIPLMAESTIGRKKLHKKKSFEHRQIAEERIAELFKQADMMFSRNKILANRYVFLARKISMKYKVKIPRELKRKFCKECSAYLRPGVNCRIRTAKGRVIYYCLDCKRFMRFVIGKKSKKKIIAKNK
jgi:ribonuclease P protein subunit RPR2